HVYSFPPPRVEAKAKAEGKKATEAKDKGSGSPGRLLAPTVGDVIKDVTGGRGKVVGLSLKDRSALLPAGHRPDACYWMDLPSGQFITSTYYRDTPHAWVREFNRPRPADRWLGRDWGRARDDEDHVKWA